MSLHRAGLHPLYFFSSLFKFQSYNRNMNIKVIIIAVASTLLATSITFGGYILKLKVQNRNLNNEKLEIMQEKNEILSELHNREKEVMEARQAIVDQNKAIADFKITVKKKLDEANSQNQKTINKYERLLAESKESLTADNSCENQLELIKSAWQEFLYE